MWVRLIARMFEAMAGNFAYSGDIHLLLNVLNGALILHSEDSCILRYVMATYINAAHNFKNIFSTNGSESHFKEYIRLIYELERCAIFYVTLQVSIDNANSPSNLLESSKQ